MVKNDLKHLGRVFRSFVFAVTLTVMGAPLVLATPVTYTFTGGVEGTAVLDFMQPDGSTTAVGAYNLTFLGTTYSHNDGTGVNLRSSSGSPNDGITLWSSPPSPIGQHIRWLFRDPPVDLVGTYTATFVSNGLDLSATNDHFSPVPEPSTILLLSTGLLGLAGYRWQQRRREGTQVA